MKLVSLNIWGGRLFKPLVLFVKEQSKSTDIFCFQEVLDTSSDTKITHEQRADILKELQKALPDFRSYFAPATSGFDFENSVDFPLEQGLAIFVHKFIQVKEHGDIFVYKSRNQHTKAAIWKDSFPKSLQYINFEINEKEFWVGNLHGIWAKEDTDTEARLNQSEKIIEFFNSRSGEKILCGDFNLSPNTKSLEILESNMKNLIKDFKITDTRGKMYKKPNKFADYILVTPGVQVTGFEVPQVSISDHLPMILEFN